MLQKTQQIENTEIIDTFKVLDDKISLRMFRLIEEVDGWSTNGNIGEVAGTTKRYYSRMARLIAVGLVKRKQGVYSLTSFGEIISKAQKPMIAACNERHILQVLDSIDKTTMPKEEYKNIVERLVVDERLREMLLS